MNENQTILIIDDIQENIDILEHQLTAEKFNVLSANEAPKGLHILKKEHINLVLLDIHMPIIDGITLLSNIREDKSLSHVAVLMVTADDDIKMALNCLKKGACGYITKPYSMKQIKQQIEHCFSP
jgi:CheY-like chemotaxis protein